MRILLGFVFAALLCSPAAAQPEPATFATAVRDGSLDASTYNFADADFWARTSTERTAWREAAAAALITPEGLNTGCEVADLRGISAFGWVRLAELAPNANAWANAAEHLRHQLAALDALAERRAAGRRDAGIRSSGAARYRDALEDTDDASAREALRRAIRDQTWREQYAVAPTSLPPLAAAQWPTVIGGALATLDCDNTNWLRTQLSEINWFERTRYGPRADQAAWLIAQHADRSPDFQRAVLTRLEGLPPGATNPANFAFLWDRVAVSEGQLQRYGTQIHCRDGAPVALNGVEDETGIDERRAAVGLGSWDSYWTQMRGSLRC
ncbi:MAG: hypothetical protein KDA35_06570 [Hyphomonadaceae bacterium]|nr:hypothetical protein [Hyphomonadaceae bacterium]